MSALTTVHRFRSRLILFAMVSIISASARAPAEITRTLEI
jgi:hypothetical protein